MVCTVLSSVLVGKKSVVSGRMAGSDSDLQCVKVMRCPMAGKKSITVDIAGRVEIA